LQGNDGEIKQTIVARSGVCVPYPRLQEEAAAAAYSFEEQVLQEVTVPPAE